MANVNLDRILNNSEAGFDDEDRSDCARDCVIKHLKKNPLVFFLIFGIASGVILGVLLQTDDKDLLENKRNQMYIGFLGIHILLTFLASILQ